MSMVDWRTLRLGKHATIREAMRTIDAGACGVALLCGPDDVLLGTVSDGDVRRGLLTQVSMDDLASEVANDQPWTAHQGAPRRDLMEAMKRRGVSVLPIVDAKGCVVGVETITELLNQPTYDNPVFIMAGGLGTRLRPLTSDCPKPMLSVGGRPMLENLVEQFVTAGFRRIVISTHYLPDAIRSHFGDGAKFGAEISYVHEEFPLGTGGALGLIPAHDVTLPVIMINGDVLTNIDFADLLRHHDEAGHLATMCVRDYEFQVPFGVVQTEADLVTAMVEKPRQQCLVNAGIYVLDPHLVQAVPPNTRIDMPTLLLEAVQAGESVGTYRAFDYWLDIGRMEDYERAQVDIGLMEAG